MELKLKTLKMQDGAVNIGKHLDVLGVKRVLIFSRSITSYHTLSCCVVPHYVMLFSCMSERDMRTSDSFAYLKI